MYGIRGVASNWLVRYNYFGRKGLRNKFKLVRPRVCSLAKNSVDHPNGGSSRPAKFKNLWGKNAKVGKICINYILRIYTIGLF